MISEGPWLFVGIPDAVKVSDTSGFWINHHFRSHLTRIYIRL
uniref:Uncharacterized protein n=1 Tax=Arundo donax TaxID=35708 RepID=A0A0A9FY70_ARUDO